MRYLILFLLVFCIFGESLIPLSVGNTWMYEQRMFDFRGHIYRTDTLKLSVPDTIHFEDEIFYIYKWEESEEQDIIRNTADGISIAGIIRNGVPDFLDRSVPYLKHPMDIDETFIDRNNNIKYKYTKNRHNTKTPAGQFDTVRLLAFDIERAKPSSQEYCPGVGLIYVEFLGEMLEVRLISYDIQK